MFTSALLKRIALPGLLLAAAPLAMAQPAAPATTEAPATTAASAAPASLAPPSIPGLGGAIPGAAIQGGKLDIQVGKSIPMTDVQSYDIANPSIVGAEATKEGGLILSGKNAGSTTLMVRKSGMLGIVVYDVTVSGVDVENVLKTVKAALGGIVGLQITQEGNTIVLQGDVANRDDGQRIDHQKDVFGKTILDLSKRTYLQAGLTLMKAELAKSNFHDVTAETQLNSEGDEVLLLRGKVYSTPQKTTLIEIAKRFFDEKRIVDQVTIDSPGVEVDVEVYSFDLLRLRSLGQNTLLDQLSHITADGWTFQTGPELNPTKGPKSALNGGNVHTLTYPAITLADSVDQFLNAHNDINGAVSESRQHASVLSGQSATVTNETELNILVSGLNSGDLKQVVFGQTLVITPVVINEKSFSTNVSVELSNIVGTASGNSVPPIDRRKLTSIFNSDQGQTVVIGGNKQITSSHEEESTPFMAQIPIVNWWFKKKDNSHDGVVQVFMMTLVAPTIFAAEDQAQSLEGKDIKAKVIKNSDDNADFLKNRQRWEAEGLKTMVNPKTHPSRFE